MKDVLLRAYRNPSRMQAQMYALFFENIEQIFQVGIARKVQVEMFIRNVSNINDVHIIPARNGPHDCLNRGVMEECFPIFPGDDFITI